jgi:uncharacterized membrane protein
MSARRAAAIAMLLLALWIAAWHLQFAPPARMPAIVAAALHLLPLAPALLLLALRRRSAPFWGSIAALLLFCHGVSDAWAVPARRGLGIVEALLSVALIVAASWEGLRARWNKRRGV